jgi:hypothetical protein
MLPSAVPAMVPKSQPILPVQSTTPVTILKTLHKKVKTLLKSVPIAKKTSPLIGYCCDSLELMKDITDDINVWETWDQRLNVLIPHSIPDIYPLIM